MSFPLNENALFPVFETFHSFQGEGEHAGKSAFFIRLYGCPIQCEWCDSAGTWKRDWDGTRTVQNLSAGTLAAMAAEARPEFVVITGGEPTIHNLAPLVDALHAKKIRVHLETCGAFSICGNPDWVTLSPKPQRVPVSENWARASEIKLIISTPADIASWVAQIPNTRAGSIWLHPEWSQRENADVLEAIAAWVRARGAPYRAGWQIHKLYNVA